MFDTAWLFRVEGSRRTLTGLYALAFNLVAVGFSGFYLYTSGFGLISTQSNRGIYLMLTSVLVFLLYPARKGAPKHRPSVVDLVLIAATVVTMWYWIDQYVSYAMFRVSSPNQTDLVMGAIAILIMLETSRRTLGPVISIIAVIFLAQLYYGSYLPGRLSHPGMSVERILEFTYSTQEALFGVVTATFATFVFPFMIFGAFLERSGAGNFFMNLGTAVAGRWRGGPAKVAVLTSALFGSISGSASANVASTGAITLPAMKRLGYPPSFAAAVEAVASSGGQIMPPLMGAGAFIMVELLRLPYTGIMAAAILPALLFFWAAWCGVDRFARNYGLKGMARADLPDRRTLLATAPFFLIPFGLLLAVLFLTGYTPQFAAGVAIFAAAALLITDRSGQVSLTAALARFETACNDAARQIAGIAAIIICAGIVIGVLNLTGLGVKVTSVILALSGGELWGALLLTALACLILGMEVPTTAAYVICISVAGPALQELGLPALQAHLFVFWYALLSTITPPVCGTVFIAAGMAQTPWVPVAGQAMRLGLGLYLVPLAFVANPALIAPDSAPLLALAALAKIGLGLWLLSRGLIGAGDALWLRAAALTAGAAAIFAFGVGG